MPIKNKLATGSTVRFTAMAQMQLIHPDFFNLQIFYFIWEIAMPTRRNPVVRHGALLRKGGAHTKTRTKSEIRGRTTLPLFFACYSHPLNCNLPVILIKLKFASV